MKRTVLFVILGLLMVCGGFVLAGCGARGQSEGDCGSGAACAPVGSVPETDLGSPEPPSATRESPLEGIGPDGPPDGTLSYGRRTVAGEQGSYSWSGGRTGGCVDTDYIIPEQVLRVPTGASLDFDYGGRSATDIGLTAYPIKQNGEVDYRDDTRLPNKVENRGEAKVPFELPSGEYLLQVIVRVPGGDAAYYFRIVRPGVTEEPEDTTASAGSLSRGAVAAPPPGATTPARDNSSLYSGAYEATKDGDLIYGGDVIYRCEDLVKMGAPAMGAPAKPGPEEKTINGSIVEPLTREAVELCARAGFPPDGASP